MGEFVDQVWHGDVGAGKMYSILAVLAFSVGPAQYDPGVRPMPDVRGPCLPSEYWLSYLQDRPTTDADGFTTDEYRWWREYYPVLQGGDEHIAYTWFVVKAKSREEFERIDNPDYRHPMLEQLREHGVEISVGRPLVDCYNEGIY